MANPSLKKTGLIGLLSIASLVSGWPMAAQATPTVDRLEASVNSSIILLSDVRKFLDTVRLRSQLDPLFAGNPIAAKGASAKKPEVVDFLIDERLMAQAFPVSDAEVEQEINSIQSNNHMDRSTLKNALRDQGFSFDDYFELIRMSASKRNLIDRDIRTKVAISDDDIKNYYFNQLSKTTPSAIAYQLQMITVSTSDFKSPAAAREVAQRALDDLRKGDSFEEVSKRAGSDSSGDLGTITEDQMSPLVRAQVKKLKIGETSEIFASPAGYHILRLVDMKSGDTDRLQKMKEEIRAQLTAAEYQHQIQLWIQRQRQSAFIHRAGETTSASIPSAK